MERFGHRSRLAGSASVYSLLDRDKSRVGSSSKTLGVRLTRAVLILKGLRFKNEWTAGECSRVRVSMRFPALEAFL
jgi:hypothetical protein